jgi:hypothetical protein
MAILSVVILGTELRETDEVDRKKFTMYTLDVRADGEEVGWTLSRRYSQFDFLRLALLAAVPEFPPKGVPEFPPKVVFGNLAAIVVGNRRVSLEVWLNALLHHDDEAVRNAPELRAFCEAKRDALYAEGGDFPALPADARDVQGRRFIDAAYRDHFVIYSVGSRYNFQQLQNRMKPAQEALLSRFPDALLTFVNAADLEIVPPALRGQVSPFLVKLDDVNANKTATMFGSGVEGAPYCAHRMHFFAAFEPGLLQTLGLIDGAWTFRVIVTLNGKVVKSLQSSTPNFAQEYVGGIAACIDGDGGDAHRLPLELRGRSDAEAAARAAAAEITLGAGATHLQRVEVTAAHLAQGDAWVAWDFSSTSGDVGFGLVYEAAPGGGGERSAAASGGGSGSVTIVPRRLFDAHKYAVRGCARAHSVGTFVATYDNIHSRFKRKGLHATCRLVIKM